MDSRNFKVSVISFIIIVMLLTVVSCNRKEKGGQTQAGSKGKIVNVQLSHGSSAEHPIEIGSQTFVNVINSALGEKFLVRSFPNGVLYNNNWTTLLEMLQTGASQIGVESISAFGSVVESISAMQIPFMFDSDKHIKKFLATDSEILKLWQQQFEEKNLVVLGIAPRTFRQLLNNKKTVKRPIDLQGMIFRVPENPFFVRIFQLLGTKPVPMPSSEIYTSIQLGTVNGEDNSISNVFDDKTYEVANYMTLWYYIADGDMLVMNKDFYDSLDTKEKGIFHQAAEEWVKVRSDLGYKFENHAYEEMKKAGVQFYRMSSEEKLPFKELVTSMYEEMKQKLGDPEWNSLLKAVEASQKN